MTQLQEFNAYLESRVGKSPYVWGGQGQEFESYEALFAFIERHESGNDEKRALAYAKKLQAAGVPIEDIRVFDCSGLGMFWLQNTKKIFKNDMSANSLYKQCKPISRSELRVGDQVFRGSSSKKTHIGYVVEIRNGVPYIIEAKGRDDGTVKRQINASGSAYWKYCGRPKYFEKDIISGSAQKTTLSRLLKFEYKAKNAATMRVKAGAQYAAVKTVPKGAYVTYMGKLGDWLRVYYNGKTGYVLASQFSRCAYMRGDDVKAIQLVLQAAGFDPGEIDGVCGPQTIAAVVAFQTAKGLEVDGIVGPLTWAALGL